MVLAGLVSADVATSGFSIDRANRNAVVAGYHRYYVASENYPATMGWTGDTGTCTAGTVSAEFQNDVLRRINYYRAQVGLPSDIYFNSDFYVHAQQAALMMAKEDNLSHTPGAGWACYRADGAQAAWYSNLSLGRYGPGAVDQQIEDDGPYNSPAGHRRWLLYSREASMSHGSVPADGSYKSASAIWVQTNPKPAPTPQGVAWPNDGYVPWNLVPNDGLYWGKPRWSYSYPAADFSSATITMSQGGTSIPVVKEAVATGYGDNAVVWRPSGIPNTAPSSDTPYTVTISGISGGPSSTVTYTVTLIDPDKVNDPPVVSGPLNPVTGSTTPYTFTATNEAEAYQFNAYEGNSSVWLEGAESSPVPRVMDYTTGYSLLSSDYQATGLRSFHLATPAMTGEGDSFVVDRLIQAASGSQIQFKYRRFFMHADTKLRVELSTDDGASYSTVQSISGPNPSNSSTNWDPAFISNSVNVPSGFFGKVLRLRFRLEPTGTTYVGTSSDRGIYIDDITVTGSSDLTEVNTQSLAGGASGVDFTPAVAGKTYLLVMQPQLGGQWMEFGPALEVVSVAAPVITSSSTAEGVQGELFSYTVTASNTPTSYGASGLPAGAAINTASGQITGQLAPGTYPGITISATNAGSTGTAPLTIQILTGYQDAVADLYPGLGLPDDDDDGDGVTNFLEVAVLGRNPLVRDCYAPANYSLTKEAPGVVLRLKKSGVAGISYVAKGSSSMLAGTWSTTGISVIKDDASDLEVACSISEAKRFLSVFVSQNSEPTE